MKILGDGQERCPLCKQVDCGEPECNKLLAELKQLFDALYEALSPLFDSLMKFVEQLVEAVENVPDNGTEN